MLGGGTFITQNKKLPGSYINFASAARASVNLSDRGIATIALELDWGTDGEVFEVTADDFRRYSRRIFGYEYSHEKLKGIRDCFKNARVLQAYKLNSGEKANNTYGTAPCSGTVGNGITHVIKENINDSTKFDVMTYLNSLLVDTQTVSKMSELEDTSYCVWKRDATLAATAGVPMTGGTNGTVTGESHQSYLDKIEGYSFNTMGVVTTDETVKELYAAFTKRMRDEVGAKFQIAIYNYAGDYEGIINVKNKVTDEGWSEASLVYWITGASAGCAVNRSNTNKFYDGEFTIDTDYTQAQLEAAIDAGELVMHRVNSDVRVLTDINSLTTVTDDKGKVFQSNQTIRVIDQIANDTALLFNTKYLGVVPNDESGRISFWSDCVQQRQLLADIGAIDNFSDQDVSIEMGNDKRAIAVGEKITVTGTMEQLYQTVTVS